MLAKNLALLCLTYQKQIGSGYWDRDSEALLILSACFSPSTFFLQSNSQRKSAHSRKQRAKKKAVEAALEMIVACRVGKSERLAQRHPTSLSCHLNSECNSLL